MEKFLDLCDQIDALPESVIILFIFYAFILIYLLKIVITEFKSCRQVKCFFKLNKFK